MMLTLLAMTVLSGAPQAPPDDPDTALSEQALGLELFRSPALSSTGTVSCATCHDPKRSFTDGLHESTGVLGVKVGSHTPTLFGLAHAPGFPSAGHMPPERETGHRPAPSPWRSGAWPRSRTRLKWARAWRRWSPS